MQSELLWEIMLQLFSLSVTNLLFAELLFAELMFEESKVEPEHKKGFGMSQPNVKWKKLSFDFYSNAEMRFIWKSKVNRCTIYRKYVLESLFVTFSDGKKLKLFLNIYFPILKAFSSKGKNVLLWPHRLSVYLSISLIVFLFVCLSAFP